MTDIQSTKQYGKFVLLERVARGGMAELFRAKIIGSEGFEKLVAIKKILPHLADQEEFISAFIDEARLAAFLQHKNIVHIFDFGEMAGSYYISMEYLSGMPLKNAMNVVVKNNSVLGLGSAGYIVGEICSGLAYAHNLKDLSGNPLNIIHRDIGPQNIFITFDGQIKIIDFGIARAASHNSATTVGSLKGKLAYMSPEQAGCQPIDQRSDIFSIGIILYELVTGKHLYFGDQKQILSQAAGAKFKSSREVRPGLPTALHKILDKALACNPDERYQSVASLQADLENCCPEIQKKTSKDLARLMAKLFAEEARLEKEALRKAATTELSNQIETSRDPSPPDLIPTVLLASPRRSSNWRLVILGIILIATAATVLLFPENRRPIKHFLLTRFFQPKSVSIPAPPPVPLEIGTHRQAEIFFADLIRSATQDKSARVFSAEEHELLDSHASFLIAENPEDALVLLRETTKYYPYLAPVHYHIARLYTFRQQAEKAIAAYQRAIDLDDHMVDAFFNLGYLYANQKEYDKAEEMYNKVILLNPPFIDEALFNLAVIENKRGKRELSLKHAREALRYNPANQQAAKLIEWHEAHK